MPTAPHAHLPERGSLSLSGRFHADRSDPRDTGKVRARCHCGHEVVERELRQCVAQLAIHCNEPIHDVADWVLP